MGSDFEPGPDDLKGEELVEAVRAHPTLIADAMRGFEGIKAGNNSVITVAELEESLANGKPVI